MVKANKNIKASFILGLPCWSCDIALFNINTLTRCDDCKHEENDDYSCFKQESCPISIMIECCVSDMKLNVLGLPNEFETGDLDPHNWHLRFKISKCERFRKYLLKSLEIPMKLCEDGNSLIY